MKSKWNPVSVGSFVIGAIILITLGLIYFKSLSLFHKPLRFVSYFDQSVQGLSVGSDIKMRGVLVGSIVSLHVYYDWNKNKSAIAVIGELNNNALIDDSGQKIDMNNSLNLEHLIRNGLRAEIDLLGITGMQYVQLAFFDPKKQSTNDLSGNSPYIVIPTVDSGVSKFTDNLFTITENFSKVDMAGISNDLKALLASLNKKTEELDLRKITIQVSSAAEAIKQLAQFIEQNPSSLIFGRKPAPKKR
ncbi:MAG: MCE family protein [Verrucomicrobia bacterium]|jgi:paraquat-inducible protein B|nr:MAG: MCE family protein [Verrucomicrobiota bacterium]MDH4469548.1 MlaD family protein [Verrucomicrobiae bacterium]